MSMMDDEVRIANRELRKIGARRGIPQFSRGIDIGGIRTSEIINDQASMNFQASSESLDAGVCRKLQSSLQLMLHKEIRMKPENSLMLDH